MKKLLAIAICAAMFTTARSQKVYVQGGVNLSNITTTNSGATESSKLLTSFNAGIMARSNANEPIALEAGLLVEGKGAKPVVQETLSIMLLLILCTWSSLSTW